MLAINELLICYQVSFVIDDIEHDNDNGDGDEIRHKMA